MEVVGPPTYGRGEEVDRCIRLEGDEGEAGLRLSVEDEKDWESHAPMQGVCGDFSGGQEERALLLENVNGTLHKAQLVEDADASELGGYEECFGDNTWVQNYCEGRQEKNGMGEHDGCGGQGGLRKNKHIRFMYEESEVSNCSDSIQEYDGDEQRLLTMRQRLR